MDRNPGIQWEQISDEEWHGHLNTLFIVAKREKEKGSVAWHLSLHDVLMDGWTISIVPVEETGIEAMQHAALTWARETVSQWKAELDAAMRG